VLRERGEGAPFLFFGASGTGKGSVSNSGRVFTLILILLGVGIIAYTLGLVAQAMVSFQLRSIMGRR
jgi:hypothetical protein